MHKEEGNAAHALDAGSSLRCLADREKTTLGLPGSLVITIDLGNSSLNQILFHCVSVGGGGVKYHKQHG